MNSATGQEMAAGGGGEDASTCHSVWIQNGEKFGVPGPTVHSYIAHPLRHFLHQHNSALRANLFIKGTTVRVRLHFLPHNKDRSFLYYWNWSSNDSKMKKFSERCIKESSFWEWLNKKQRSEGECLTRLSSTKWYGNLQYGYYAEFE